MKTEKILINTLKINTLLMKFILKKGKRNVDHN